MISGYRCSRKSSNAGDFRLIVALREHRDS